MPPPTWGKLRCGITFDENKVPLDKGELQGVLRRGTNPPRHSANRGDFQKGAFRSTWTK
jgi:hypothetical protein